MLVSSVQGLQMRDTKWSGSNLQPLQPRPPPDGATPTYRSNSHSGGALNSRCRSVCGFGFGGMGGLWRNDFILGREKKNKKTREKLKEGGWGVCLCVSFVSSHWANQKTTTEMYICQTWEASDAKCQRARWNTDKFPPQFFFPHLFKQMLWIFIFIIQELQKETKKKNKQKNFSSNRSAEKNKTKRKRKKKPLCKLGNTSVALKKRKNKGRGGAENIRNHVGATSETSGWMPVPSWFLLRKKKKKEHSPYCYSWTSRRKTSVRPNLHTAAQRLFKQLDLKTRKKEKSEGGREGGKSWCGVRYKQKKLGLEVHIYIYLCIYIYLYL